jgi:hypothetical protein
MNNLLKRIGPALLIILVLLGGGIIVGALVFGDDRGEFFDRFTEKRATVQPMEVRGDWLGMSLADLSSPTAQRRAAFPPSLKGVMVTEISESLGWRPRQAGVMNGDVISAVNKQKVGDINEFYDVTRKVDIADAIYLDVNRWAQVVTLVIPAINRPVAAPMGAGMPQQQMMGQAQPQVFVPQGAQMQQMQMQGAPMQMQAMAPQPAPVQQQQGQLQAPWGIPAQQQAAWLNPAAAGLGMQPAAWTNPQAQQPQPQGQPLWVCRRHGLAWQQQAVQPGFRCPLCNDPLRIAQ